MNDKKRGIGSKQAAKLAQEKFGEIAYVLRSGKTFEVGKLSRPFWGFHMRLVKGYGKSWETALIDAGIVIPVAPVVESAK